MDKRSAGQEQIEAAIGIMLNARGMKLETPIRWREDTEHDALILEARISGRDCHWILIREAVENYVSDLNVRHSVDFNLQSYFIPH
jgi:hypothetical protein